MGAVWNVAKWITPAPYVGLSSGIYYQDKKKPKSGSASTPNSPNVSSSSTDINREDMRKRGRAALVASTPQGVLGNAPTGRAQLLAA